MTPYVGIYPRPLDPENITPEEQALIDAWQIRYDNAEALQLKVHKAQDWIISGPHERIMDFFYGGPLVTKAGQIGIVNCLEIERIMKPAPTDWLEGRLPDLRDNYLFKGWTTDDGNEELKIRNYPIYNPN